MNQQNSAPDDVNTEIPTAYFHIFFSIILILPAPLGGDDTEVCSTECQMMIVLEHRTLYDYADSHHGIMVRWQDKLSRRIALLSRLQREIFARRKRENIMTTTMMFYQAMKIKKSSSCACNAN